MMITKIKTLTSCTPHFSKRIESFILFSPFALAAAMFVGCVVYELIQPEMLQQTRDTIYIKFGNVTFALSILLSILYGRKYGIGMLRSIVYSGLSFGLIFSLTSRIWCNIDVAILGTGSVASFRSILMLPVLCFLVSRFDQHSIRTLCDYLTPYYFFQHGITTHACWIAGCCSGKATSWGVYNHLIEHHTFPAQPYAILLALSVSLGGLLYAKKKDYQTHGEVFGSSIICYGFFRYIMEFFTSYRRVIGPFSNYSIYSLLLILLGFAVLHTREPNPKKYLNSDNENNSTEVLL